MKIIFAGTPEFAAIQLKAVVEAGFEVKLVLTQPDRPRGRGQKIAPSAVKAYALDQSIPVSQPTSLKDPSVLEQLKALKPDLIIVSAYGMMVPQAILDLPAYGCWNVHASILPRWRGAAPIHYAIWKGDKTTGVSLMQLEAGLDSGPVLLTESIPILPTDTTGSMLEKLSHLGAKVLIDGLNKIDNLKPIIQDSKLVTLSPKINKNQALIDWTCPSLEIERMIRAFDPNPGCYTHYQQERIKIFCAKVLAHNQTSLEPGVIQHVSKDGIDVSTQDGLLQLKTIQLPGKKKQTLLEILNATPDRFKIGEKLI